MEPIIIRFTVLVFLIFSLVSNALTQEKNSSLFVMLEDRNSYFEYYGVKFEIDFRNGNFKYANKNALILEDLGKCYTYFHGIDVNCYRAQFSKYKEFVVQRHLVGPDCYGDLEVRDRCRLFFAGSVADNGINSDSNWSVHGWGVLNKGNKDVGWFLIFTKER